MSNYRFAMPPDHLHGSPAVVVSANGKKRSCRLPASQQPRLKAAPGLLHPVSHALGSAFLSAAMPMLVVSLPTHMSTAMPNVLIRSFAINRTRTALVLASFLLLIGACAGTPPSWATMSPCNYVALPLRTYWEGSQGVDSLNVELSPQRNRDARTAVWKAASAARHLPPAPLPPSIATLRTAVSAERGVARQASIDKLQLLRCDRPLATRSPSPWLYIRLMSAVRHCSLKECPILSSMEL